MTKIEFSLSNITCQVNQVLETCNENARSIQTISFTIMEFMKQMQLTRMGAKNLEAKGGVPSYGTNLAHVIKNSHVVAQEGKNLAIF
jgi:hypothetical protein